MEVLDEYALHRSEGKDIKAFSQIVKLLGQTSWGERWDLGSNSWQPHNLFESVPLVQEQEPYDVGQRENGVSRGLYVSAFPELSQPMGTVN